MLRGELHRTKHDFHRNRRGGLRGGLDPVSFDPEHGRYTWNSD